MQLNKIKEFNICIYFENALKKYICVQENCNIFYTEKKIKVGGGVDNLEEIYTLGESGMEQHLDQNV